MNPGGEKRSLSIWSEPRVQGGEPMVWGSGARVIDLLDRVDAGDPPAEVADDFMLALPSLELLLDLRTALADTKGEK